ncbi:DnaJ domain-containing protein [Methylococcus geothermalis]|uniref:DnaJ domain-containing protein n=1 Tax=Methylococcus geothermalis TaxID=2681310 RepID=UPI001CB7162A|nr:DnaJ domain-containing protein [Methylococcus geothermalis]
MQFKDYYQIMGVSRDASQEEIERTNRKPARTAHPDVGKEPHAEERFKKINEAHEVQQDKEHARLATGLPQAIAPQTPSSRLWMGISNFTATSPRDLTCPTMPSSSRRNWFWTNTWSFRCWKSVTTAESTQATSSR